MVHHIPEVTPDLLTRLKNLGCGVQMGAFRWVTSADPKPVGPPFRTIVDHGIQVGIHGDGVHIAPLNPWSHIFYAVTGLDSFGNQVNAGQQLTRAEALKIFTHGNSWFLRMEDKIGTLETGKLADLVVLDANPLDDIHNSEKVRYVMKNGRLYEGETLNEVWPRQKALPTMWWWEQEPKGVK
jgi:predicted amidohydrolase YtcJ